MTDSKYTDPWARTNEYVLGEYPALPPSVTLRDGGGRALEQRYTPPQMIEYVDKDRRGEGAAQHPLTQAAARYRFLRDGTNYTHGWLIELGMLTREAFDTEVDAEMARKNAS